MFSNKQRFLCRIADCIVEIPVAGNMFSRCRHYIENEDTDVDIFISEDKYDLNRWKSLSEEKAIYLESGFQFYRELLFHNGMMFHASAVELEGKAYLFSGPSGVGKSTHTELWKSAFGERVQVFNDDKPALRKINGTWFAYGTPWSGKDEINQNMKVPLAGICFLKQGEENSIRKMSISEVIRIIISQTNHKFRNVDYLDNMLCTVDKLVREIPIYELTNKPEIEAVMLSYEMMCKGAEEAGL